MSYGTRRDPLEGFLRDLERLFRVNHLYPPGHDQISEAARSAASSLAEWGHPIRMSFIGGDLMAEDRSLRAISDTLRAIVSGFRNAGWEGARIEPGCGAEELRDWVTQAASGQPGAYARGGIVAGPLDQRSSDSLPPELERWAGGYSDYLPDVDQALREIHRLKPEGLDRARAVVQSVLARLAAGEDLLTPVRKLKESDEYSFTHALNVAILSASLARDLGLPRELIGELSLGALCHDVGKEKVPEEILNKPGQLTPEERQVMNRHPADGATSLLGLPTRLHPLVPTIAYEHHMHPDASGYPDGRHPEDFRPHPASLLVEVADVFDALRTIRPYRGALSEAKTVNIMLNDAQKGRLDRASLSVMVRVLGLLSPGSRVRLADGRSAVVLAATEPDPLGPLVETEGGEILDLSDPQMPPVAEVLDTEGAEGAAAVH